MHISESDLMPGYLTRSHVPPGSLLRSRTTYLLPGQRSCGCQAALIPEIPAPTTTTSNNSDMLIEVSNPMTLSPNRSIDSASTPSDRLDAAQKVRAATHLRATTCSDHFTS